MFDIHAADAIASSWTNPLLRFVPPSHKYLHICQQALCAQEATTHPVCCVTAKMCIKQS